MSQEPRMSLTADELQELLSVTIRTAVQEAVRPSPLEQRKIDAEEEQDRRKLAMQLQLAKIEDDSMRQKKNGCSHMRYTANSGRLAGMPAPKGAVNAEWVTGGQALQNGMAVTICQRCSHTWVWKPNSEEYSYVLQNGLLGTAPPAPELLVEVTA